MTAPERSLAQRRAALLKANAVRTARKQLKADLKAYRTTTRDVLADVPDYIETMKVLDLLLATPKIGRVKALAALNEARVSPSKTVGGLSDRQRFELVGILSRIAVGLPAVPRPARPHQPYAAPRTVNSIATTTHERTRAA